MTGEKESKDKLVERERFRALVNRLCGFIQYSSARDDCQECFISLIHRFTLGMDTPKR